MTDPAFHCLADGTRIAFRRAPGAEPAIVFLPGYMSDMAGGKAQAIFDWAQTAGRACLLLDYSGCGMSGGDFAEGTLTRWQGEVAALVAHLGLSRLVLVGSSMGGWLMLLLAQEVGPRVAGLVGIAAAPDFTEWGFTAEQKAALAADETIYEASPYGPEPTPTHPGFWADGEARKLLARGMELQVPLRLIHGAAYADVPWEISCRLAASFHSADVQLLLIEGGDHRLSRPEDIARILGVIGDLLAVSEGRA